MVLTHLGWDVQIGSTMSNTSTAVLAGLTVTGTGSGIGGICNVSIGLTAPVPGGAGTGLCAVAGPAYVANAREVTRTRINEHMGVLSFLQRNSKPLVLNGDISPARRACQSQLS